MTSKTAQIIYGSSGGATEDVAERLLALLRDRGFEASCHDVSKMQTPRFLARPDLLLLGCSTWNWGDIQDDFELALPDLSASCERGELRGQKVALFGCGDGFTYPDTFGDALGILAEPLQGGGAGLIGRVSRSHYDFEDSKALCGAGGDKLLGLLLDEDNEPEKTQARLLAWVATLEAELEGQAEGGP